MTLIVSFLVAHLGVILGALGMAGTTLWALFERKSAQTVKASAATTVAQAQQQIAAVGQQVAQQNAAAAEAATQAIQNERDAQQQAAAIPADQLDAEGAKLGILRKE